MFTTSSDEITEIYKNLALDLDYYEPNEAFRKEAPSYYGEERLIKEIEEALTKLKNHK